MSFGLLVEPEMTPYTSASLATGNGPVAHAKLNHFTDPARDRYACLLARRARYRMTDVAFDTSVILTWLLQEPSWQRAHNLLKNPGITPVLPGPALTEIMMIARSKGNASTGPQMLLALQGFGTRVEHPVDTDLLRAAELLEVSQVYPGASGATLSLRDASILAVVERLDIKVVSKDPYWSELADAGHTTAAVLDY